LQLPHFIVAGVTRGGTSTLHKMLKSHPHIQMPDEKELHFFERDQAYAKGISHYAKNFQNCPADKICGDVTPTYFNHGYTLSKTNDYQYNADDDAMTRIAKDLPDIKIILTLRHPAMRAHSFFARMVWQGHEKCDNFETVLNEERTGTRTPQNNPICPIYLGNYKAHMQHMLAHIPKDRILVLIMEEWTQNPTAAMQKIEQFLGLPAANIDFSDLQPVNQGRRSVSRLIKKITAIAPRSKPMRLLSRYIFSRPGYKTLPESVLKDLINDFATDIAYIEDYLGRPIKAWRTIKS